MGYITDSPHTEVYVSCLEVCWVVLHHRPIGHPRWVEGHPRLCMEGALVHRCWVHPLHPLHDGNEDTTLPYVDVGHQVYLRFPFLPLHLITESHRMSKFIKSYKSLVLDLDHAFNLDNGMGYKFLIAHTFFILGICVYSVGLEMGWIV